MLLIPFIENSFKHGLQVGDSNSYIHINLTIKAKGLELSVKNNAGNNEKVYLEKRRGIGI